jgi:hypothetical protein
MELSDHRIPTGIASGNALGRNVGQAIEAGLRTVQVSVGNRAVQGVERRRRDTIECALFQSLELSLALHDVLVIPLDFSRFLKPPL